MKNAALFGAALLFELELLLYHCLNFGSKVVLLLFNTLAGDEESCQP